MRLQLKYFFLIYLFLSCLFSVSQNENSQWYFGNQAGINFLTNPPTALLSGSMSSGEGCASIANGSGSVQFYTDGATIWDQTHQVMANGSSLLGNNASSQSALILKQPGSTSLYYVITQGAGSVGLNFSVVNMTLAAGLGSVTVKNTTLVASSQSTEKLTGVKHCNGTDFLIVTHDLNSAVFRSYLLTSTGLNTTPVTSTIGSVYSSSAGLQGWLKISQNGKKIGAAMFDIGAACELFDFNNTSGVVSNSLSLPVGLESAYGCEFSPDGSKFYASVGSLIYQWDLCAGNGSAIVSSLFTFNAAPSYAMQLGPDGKIYVARNGNQAIGVINTPNGLGTACNYSNTAQSISPKICNVGITNFASGFLNQHLTPPPFTYFYNSSTGCQTASFTASPNPSVYCPAAGYSITSLSWNFGDPNSNTANVSTLTNPTHLFTQTGIFNVQLILHYSCGGGTDTITQPVSILGPTLSLTTSSVSCASLGSATLTATGGVGPYSYTWMPSMQTTSVATGISPGTYSVTLLDAGINCLFTSTVGFSAPNPMTGSLSNTSSFTCNGATSGTAAISNLAGGSGNQTYVWTNGSSTQSNSIASGLGAGFYTITVTDALTNCILSKTFQITQPPALTLNLSASSPSSCAGTTVVLTGTTTGGTSAYTYTWSAGPVNRTYSLTQQIGGNYIYMLNSRDMNNCLITKTISVTFISKPPLIVNNVSICPQATGTLMASGATSYLWSNNITSSVMIDNPVVNTTYTVIGSALGCTASAIASINIHPVPSISSTNNSPICSSKSLFLSASNAQTFIWMGPASFTSTSQYPNINPALVSNSGIYNLTITAITGCTASTSTTVTIDPAPTITALGSTICVNSALNLSSNSPTGFIYLWKGPGSFSSNLSNPSIPNPQPSISGNYTVKVTSAIGCTNSAAVNVTVTAMPTAGISGDNKRCVNETLNLSGSGGLTYTWVGPNGFSSTLKNPLISNVTLFAGGVYTLSVIAGPCSVNLTKSVTVYPLPIPTASNNGPVCENKKLFLSVNNSGTSYFWYAPNSALPISYLQNPLGIDSVKQSQSGVYTVTAVDINSCKASDTTSVVVLPNPDVTASSTTVCLFEPATLVAQGGLTYNWYGPFNFFSTNQVALIASAGYTNTTTYTVVGKAANSCTASSTASINTLSLPVAKVSLTPTGIICSNNTFTLFGYGGDHYEWKGPYNLLYTGQTLAFFPNTRAYGGTYTLIVTDKQGCKGTTSIPVSIESIPDGSLISDLKENCIPFCREFKLESFSQKASRVKANWSVNNKTYAGNVFAPCFSEAGKYIITGNLIDTVSFCANTLTFAIDAHELPVADFTWSPAAPIENLDHVLFTNLSKGDSITEWNWFFKNNEGFKSSQQNISHSFADAGLFAVAYTIKNTWGCSDTVIKALRVETDFSIYVPNVFTPNGNGLNDLFIPVLRGVKLYKFSVFNRWGGLIFDTNIISAGWDGTFNSQDCKNEVYTWIIDASGYNGDRKQLKGYVSLIR